MIPSATLDRILEATDLPSLVREYGVQLRPAAGGYVAQCCFHQEKTPSLRIHAAGKLKNHWHCFGCSAGGNAFGFISRIEGLPFPRAVEFLADRAGIVVDRRRKSRAAAYFEAQDSAMMPSWWATRWQSVRDALDAEYALLLEDKGDLQFAHACGRLLRQIEEMPIADKLTEFRQRVTISETDEWNWNRRWDRDFAEAWQSLAAEPITPPLGRGSCLKTL